MGTVLLVRHGETEWNHERRIQGWAPSGLNDRGCRQAERAGDKLGGIYDVDRIVASDLARTRETARILRPRLGVARDRVAFDRGWRERHFGTLQGLSHEGLFEGYPEFDVMKAGAAALEATPEGGESIVDVRSRVLDAWVDLAGDIGDETAVVVTHGGPIHTVRAYLQEHDIITELREHSTGNCEATEIAFADGVPTMVGVITPDEA